MICKTNGGLNRSMVRLSLVKELTRLSVELAAPILLIWLSIISFKPELVSFDSINISFNT